MSAVFETIVYKIYSSQMFLVMSWIIEFHEDFDHEFQGLDEKVQGEILAKLIVL